MVTIAEIAQGPDFSILLTTVQYIDDNTDADLVGALSGTTPLTVFAPNNAAFAALAADLGYTGAATDTDAIVGFFVANVDAPTLRTIVEYHVLPGAQTAADIAAQSTLTTLQGSAITAELPILNDLEPDLLNPAVLTADVAADNGIVHVIDRVLLPVDLPGNDALTITGIVLQSGSGFDDNPGDFDMLREAVVAAGLADALNDADADLTVFAPTDAAFVGLSQTLGYSGSDEAGALTYIIDALDLLSGGAAISLLTDVLTYHVAPQSLQSAQVLADPTINTLLGASFTAEVTQGGVSLVDLDPDLPNPSLQVLDIQAANGIVHVIDGVLIPADLLVSDGANDVDFIIDGDADTSLTLGADADFANGKGGDDTISAGDGDDIIFGGAGNDGVFGGAGNDLMLGQDGDDRVFGGTGDDSVFGADGADIVGGGDGTDNVGGGDGRDNIFGGRGDDTVYGGSGDDTVSGGAGDDIVGGSGGEDTIYASTGNDTIFGGAGDDLIFAGKGVDFALGGAGADIFSIHRNDGFLRIDDFQDGVDLLDISAFGLSGIDDLPNPIEGGPNYAYINLGSVGIALRNFDVTNLSSDDFLF